MIKKTFLNFSEDFKVYNNVKGCNGVVVCTLRCKLNFIYDFVDNYKKYNKYFTYYGGPHSYFSTKAVAICSKEDTFNADYGKKIALSKAKKEAFNKAEKYYIDMLNSINVVASNLDEVIGNVQRAKDSESKHLQELINN